jgi:hypothetical protein
LHLVEAGAGLFEFALEAFVLLAQALILPAELLDLGAELLQLLQDTQGHGHRVEHLDGRHRCLDWLHIRLNHYSANPQRKRQGALIKSAIDYRLVQGPDGRSLLTWQLDAAALKRWQHPEGVYVLKTSLPERTHPLAEVMRCYKGQSQVERRFHHLKGPLAVAPMFLKNPEELGNNYSNHHYLGLMV